MNISSSWASELTKLSYDLKVATYLPDVLRNRDNLEESIDRIFKRFSVDCPPNARAWVDGGQRYTINDSLIRLAPETDLALPARLAKANAAEKYCVTLNGLSAWDLWFSIETQRQMLTPLFNELGGAPASGVDFYTFLGNYGFTPFGAHDDIDHSLLWHLGPGSKVAYVWPRAAYVELTGAELSTLDYAPLIEHANRYCLSPGDLLFIPKGDFHVLQTDAFSCTLGLTLFPDDRLAECSEGLRLIALDGADNSLMDVPFTAHQLSMLRRVALESNGFVITPPVRLDRTAYDRDAIRQARLSGFPSWPLRTIQIGNRQALLVRGRAIWARTNPVFDALCELLSDGRCVSFLAIQDQLRSRISEISLIELIMKITRSGGISLQASES